MATEPQSPLQFDRADFGTTAKDTACAACRNTLMGSYFDVNGASVCEACRYRLEEHWNGGTGAAGRFLRAVVFGVGAGVAGTILYYLVAKITGMEIGIIAIVVGFMVGKAVRVGARSRGGIPYQLLAVFLTYTSIVASYTPYLFEGMREHAGKESKAKAGATSSGTAAPMPGATPDPAAPASDASPADAAAPPATAPPHSSVGRLLFALVFLVCVLYAAPFLSLFSGGEGILGIVIIGFGLLQAWRLNRKVSITIAGPFSLGVAKADSTRARPVISRSTAIAAVCASCGTQLPSTRLTCPACHALVHADTLRALAQRAEAAERDGNPRAALLAWREALPLLPPDAAQSKQVGERIAALTRGGEPKPSPVEAAAESTPKPGKRGLVSTVLGTLGVLAAKFKFAIFFILTKLKWLAIGLAKGTTLLTMMLSMGVYWTIWGWRFALGMVLSIYVHEMGHVAALDRAGIRATAPMFIPGFGALVRLKEYPSSPAEDARVGLAGPLWGMGAALACLGAWWLTGYDFWGALAEWGARINLFNLMPLGFLDGGRGFRAISREGRIGLVLLMGAMLAVSFDMMLLIVLVPAALQALFGPAPARSERRAVAEFAVLVVVLALVAAVPGRIGVTR